MGFGSFMMLQERRGERVDGIIVIIPLSFLYY